MSTKALIKLTIANEKSEEKKRNLVINKLMKNANPTDEEFEKSLQNDH